MPQQLPAQAAPGEDVTDLCFAQAVVSQGWAAASWCSPDFTPALVRQHKILSECLGGSCSESIEKGAIKLL